jgi:hypothetical protein
MYRYLWVSILVPRIVATANHVKRNPVRRAMQTATRAILKAGYEVRRCHAHQEAVQYKQGQAQRVTTIAVPHSHSAWIVTP